MSTGRFARTALMLLLCATFTMGWSVQVAADKGLKPTFSLASTWESAYVTEGRDNLATGGILTIDGSVAYAGFTAGAWFALGDRESYKELDLYVAFGTTKGPIECSVSWTHLRFPDVDESDNEVGGGLSFAGLDHVTPGIDGRYSTGVKGGFVEVSLRGGMPVFQERLTLKPYVLKGLDFGYASDDHDGPNHLQLGLEFDLPVRGQVALTGSLSRSWAQEDVDRDGLGGVTWGTLGLSAEF